MICLTDKIVINTPNVICRGTDTLTTYKQTNKQTYRRIFSPDSGISSHSFGSSYSQRCFRLNYEFVRLLHSIIHQSDCFDPHDFLSLFLRRNSNFDEQCAYILNIYLNEYQFYLTWLTDTALLFYFQPTQVNFSSC